jgi:hypothetical protein
MEKTQDKSANSELQEQTPGNVLEQLARKGARQLLAQAMDAEYRISKAAAVEPADDHRVFTFRPAALTDTSLLLRVKDGYPVIHTL